MRAEGNATACSKIDLECYPNYGRGKRKERWRDGVVRIAMRVNVNDMANRGSLDGAKDARAIRGVFYHVTVVF